MCSNNRRRLPLGWRPEVWDWGSATGAPAEDSGESGPGLCPTFRPRCLPSPLPAMPQCLCVQFSSSYRDAGRSGFDSTPMTPLHRDSFCKGPVSEEGRVLTGCGQDSSISFWRTQFNREQPPRLLWSRSLEASADSAAADQWWRRECGRGPPAWSLVAAPSAESCQSQHGGEQPARARPQLRKSYSVPSLASEGQNSHPHPLGLEGEDGDARVNGKGVEATCAMGTRLQPSLGDTRGQRDRALKRHRAWPGGGRLSSRSAEKRGSRPRDEPGGLQRSFG